MNPVNRLIEAVYVDPLQRLALLEQRVTALEQAQAEKPVLLELTQNEARWLRAMSQNFSGNSDDEGDGVRELRHAVFNKLRGME